MRETWFLLCPPSVLKAFPVIWQPIHRKGLALRHFTSKESVCPQRLRNDFTQVTHLQI